MPNWCNNNIIIKGPKNKLKDLESAAREGNFCNHLSPMPKVLENTTADGSVNLNLKKKQVLVIGTIGELPIGEPNGI